MAQVTPDYTIVSNVALNYYDSALQEAYPAHEIKARWTRTQTIVRVIVPDTAYNAANVDAAIRQAGALDDQIGALGSSPRSG